MPLAFLLLITGYRQYVSMKKETPLTHRQYLDMHRDHKKSAVAVNLTYVHEGMDGIKRVGKDKDFQYEYKNKIISDEPTLARIKKLAIPPSWTDVWICADDLGHIQATGKDLNGRKQYRYHTNWNKLRNDTKFHRLVEFGKALPSLRRKIKKDLLKREMSSEKVIAAAISTMEETAIRIGNAGYEKMYGSYGLTTLKDKHVQLNGDNADLVFTGKKGISHRLRLKNKKLVRIIRKCRDIPGKELFQYFDEQGNRKSIDSGMVNSYIRDASGGDFSAKDFRTWTASVEALQSFCCVGEPVSESDIKQKIVAVLGEVSTKLGNSKTICKKYYVHPKLIELYQEKKLLPIISKLNCRDTQTQKGLLKNEKVLMKILTKN